MTSMPILIWIMFLLCGLIHGRMTWDVAGGKTVSKSSTSNIIDGKATYAVDNNDTTCYRTNEDGSDSQISLTIHMGGNYMVYGVAIRTSHLGLGDAMKNFEIEVISTTTGDRSVCYHETNIVSESTQYLYICPPNSHGGVIYIHLLNQSNVGILTLCDVQVLARPTTFGLYCRVFGYNILGTPFYNTTTSSELACSLLCLQTGCDIYSVEIANGGSLCRLYRGQKLVLNDNPNSSFYFKC